MYIFLVSCLVTVLNTKNKVYLMKVCVYMNMSLIIFTCDIPLCVGDTNREMNTSSTKLYLYWMLESLCLE